jgi:ADP-ribose pyrophosphatase YjhB (NUDIX family)
MSSWPWELPTLPASAGAMLFDDAGRLLLLRPTYKSGWTLPGGVMESDETPWQACRREVFEECGLVVAHGRLAAVDTRPAKGERALGLRFLFDCGSFPDDVLATVRLQAVEISEHALVAVDEALTMLRPAVSRRVGAALQAGSCVYLEDGRPLPVP